MNAIQEKQVYPKKIDAEEFVKERLVQKILSFDNTFVSSLAENTGVCIGVSPIISSGKGCKI